MPGCLCTYPSGRIPGALCSELRWAASCVAGSCSCDITPWHHCITSWLQHNVTPWHHCITSWLQHNITPWHHCITSWLQHNITPWHHRITSWLQRNITPWHHCIDYSITLHHDTIEFPSLPSQQSCQLQCDVMLCCSHDGNCTVYWLQSGMECGWFQWQKIMYGQQSNCWKRAGQSYDLQWLWEWPYLLPPLPPPPLDIISQVQKILNSNNSLTLIHLLV